MSGTFVSMARFLLTIMADTGDGERAAEALRGRAERCADHDRVTCLVEAANDVDALEQVHDLAGGIRFREVRVALQRP